MKILTKYISIEFIKLLFLCLFIFVSLFLVIDFIQKIDNLIEAHVSKGIILSYFFFKTPFIILQMTPVAVLISIIVLFSIMKKNNEIIALRACGQNVVNLSISVIILCAAISALIFIFSEFIVPYTNLKSNEIWDIEVEKQNPNSFFGSDQIWYKSENAIYSIRYFDSDKKIMNRPTFYFFDNNFRLVKRIEAEKCVWENGTWRIEKAVVQEAQPDGGFDSEDVNELILKIPETPETFIRKIKNSEEMSFIQLLRFSERIKDEGYDNTRYLVDMNVKLAFPLLSLILAFIGIPIALEPRISGIPAAISLGIGLCFIYMVVFSFSQSFGISGVLPPFLSAWTANLLFILFGIYLMISVKS